MSVRGIAGIVAGNTGAGAATAFRSRLEELVMNREDGQNEIVDVIVEAAPAGVPRRFRVRRSQIVDRTLKLPRAGGYDHLELVAAEAAVPAVFRWTMRTAIAE